MKTNNKRFKKTIDEMTISDLLKEWYLTKKTIKEETSKTMTGANFEFVAQLNYDLEKIEELLMKRTKETIKE